MARLSRPFTPTGFVELCRFYSGKPPEAAGTSPATTSTQSPPALLLG
jgi:hypothetical protein